MNININDAQDKYGKDVSITVDTWKPDPSKKAAPKPEPVAAVAGLGWQDIKLHVPVCGGDKIRLESNVVEQRPSKSKPDRGIVVSQNNLYTRMHYIE